jgi:protein TonB
MYANGFFEQQQQRRSPASLAIVVALHAAGLGAVILAGSTQFIQEERGRLIVRNIPIPPDPQPIIPDEPVDTPRPERRDTVVTQTRPEGPANDNTATTGYSEPTQPTGPIGERNVEPARDPPQDPPPPPVRREAQLDPRYSRDLQPPYPAPELRAERNGTVQIRLTIAPSGRVTAVERLSATSEHFWRATQQQALSRWRFRPATVDGRPVQGVKVMTVNFRIQDA